MEIFWVDKLDLANSHIDNIKAVTLQRLAGKRRFFGTKPAHSHF